MFRAYWRGLDRDSKDHKKCFTKFVVVYLTRQRSTEGRSILMSRGRGATFLQPILSHL
jgi:hypothetical protein